MFQKNRIPLLLGLIGALASPACFTSGGRMMMPPPLMVTNTAPPATLAGQAFSFNIQVTGGTAPYTLTETTMLFPGGMGANGTPCQGLMINFATGAVTGTPVNSGTCGPVNFTVTDSSTPALTFQFSLTFRVAGVLAITTGNLPNGTEGVAYNQTVATTGGATPLAFSISAGALPPGLMLNTTTGALAGMPTMGGTFNFTVRIADSLTPAQAVTQAYTVRILQITTASLPVAILGQPYSETLIADGAILPAAWTLASGSGPLPNGIMLSASGQLTGIPMAEGQFPVIFEITDADAPPRTHQRMIVITVVAPLLITTSLPDGVHGTPYGPTGAGVPFQATGGLGPASFSVGGGVLPPGLNLVNGVLQGTPTQGGFFAFTIDATDQLPQTASSNYLVRILEITTLTLPDGVEGQPYSHTLTVTGEIPAVIWALAAGSQLPPNLMLDPNTGVISGTPTQAGLFGFTVQATDSGNPPRTHTRALTLTITAPNPPPPPEFNGTVGNSPALPGNDPGFTYTVSNPATTDAQGLHVDFTLLTLGTFFHATQNFPPGWNCTINLQAISCDRTTLGAGASDLLPLAVDSVQIDSLATSIDLAAQLTVTNPAVNLIRPVSATVGAHPFVMAQKVHSSNNSDTASFVSTPGLTVAFTITVTNTRSGGGAAATSFTVRDTLPQGFSFVGTNPPNVCTANNLALDCPFSNLPDGGSFSFQVIVQPLNLGTFTNTVTVLGVQPLQGAGQNPSLTTTHITGPSEPTMTGVATNFTILPGDDPGFIYTIDNPATTDAQGLHVDFTLATLGTVFKALQTFPPGWICSINLQTIACDKATLSAGASDVLSPAVDSAQIDSSATSIDISAQLTAITPSTNLVRPVSATVGAHPFVIAQKVHSINNSDTASFVSAPGLTVAFTITVTNMRSGGGATATTFSMFDTLPIGFVFVDTNPPGLCNSTSPNQLECPFTNLADGGSFSFQIIVQPLSLGTFVNTVFAGNVQPLQGAGQPPSQTTTTITAPSGPDLSAACSCTSANCSDRLNPGETFTSECTVEELNNLDALAGQWTCQSSGGIRFRSITGSSGGCSIAPDGLSLSCQDDNPASSTRTYHLESETVNHSDPDESYVCSVQQAGDTDLTNNSSTVIVDGNESPVAAYTFTCSALDCTFDSSGSADSDGNIVSRDWDFDNDGVVDASGPIVPHSFSAAGIFDVRLAVTDDNGATGSTIQQVTVAASPPSNLTDIHVTRTAGPGPFSSVSSFRHDASANTLAIRMTPPPATFPIPYPGTQPGPIVGDNSLIAVGEADVFDLDFNDGFVTFFTGDGMGNFTQDGTPIPVGSLVAALAFDPTKTLLFASVSSPTFEQQIVVINVASKTVVNVVPSTMTSTFAATALLANPDPSLRVLYGLGSNASPSVGLFMWTYDLSGNLFRDFNVPAIAFPNSFAIKNQRLYIGTNASGAMGQSAGLQYAINLVAGLPAGNNFIGPIGGGGLLGEAVVRDAATGNVCKYAVDGIGNLRIFSVNENTLAIVETLSSPFLAQLGEFFFLPVAHPSQPIIYVFGVGNFDPDGPGPIPALPAAVLDVFNVDTQTCDLSNPPAGALRTIVPGPPGPISSALVVPQ